MTGESTTFTFEPIGVFYGEAKRKYDAPRQGVFAGGTGQVKLNGGNNFEAALRNLEGFERVWLLFVFNRNDNHWRPTTRPPVAARGLARVGVFASRAPYRPNPIGMSAVRLLAVKGRVLEVADADLLDGTPILDIKPYVPAADSFPAAAAGWVDAQVSDDWQIDATDDFIAAADFIRSIGGPDLLREGKLQLAHSPFDATRKRVTRRGAGKRKGTLSLRMFRLDFTANLEAHTLTLTALRSGYRASELARAEDPYADKRLHRALRDFLAHAPESIPASQGRSIAMNGFTCRAESP